MKKQIEKLEVRLKNLKAKYELYNHPDNALTLRDLRGEIRGIKYALRIVKAKK